MQTCGWTLLWFRNLNGSCSASESTLLKHPGHWWLRLVGLLVSGGLWHSQSARYRRLGTFIDWTGDTGVYLLCSGVFARVLTAAAAHAISLNLHTTLSVVLSSSPRGESRLTEVKQLGKFFIGLLSGGLPWVSSLQSGGPVQAKKFSSGVNDPWTWHHLLCALALWHAELQLWDRATWVAKELHDPSIGPS